MLGLASLNSESLYRVNITGLVTIIDTALSVTHTSAPQWQPSSAWSPPSCPSSSPSPRCSCGWGVLVTCPAPACSVPSHCRFPLCSMCGHSGLGSSGHRGGGWGGGWTRRGTEWGDWYAWSKCLRSNGKICNSDHIRNKNMQSCQKQKVCIRCLGNPTLISKSLRANSIYTCILGRGFKLKNYDTYNNERKIRVLAIKKDSDSK